MQVHWTQLTIAFLPGTDGDTVTWLLGKLEGYMVNLTLTTGDSVDVVIESIEQSPNEPWPMLLRVKPCNDHGRPMSPPFSVGFDDIKHVSVY